MGRLTATQWLVDQLAERLRTPVLLDDPHLVPIAYSRHDAELDDVRVESILGRSVTEAAREALLGQGIEDARGPIRTESIPGLGLRARICTPVLGNQVLLGYLWVFDAGFDESAFDRLRDAAQSIADALLDDPEEGWRARTLEALVGSDVEAAASAGRAIAARGIVLRGARVLVADADPPTRASDSWMARATATFLRRHGAAPLLAGTRGTQQVLVALDDGSGPARRLQRLALDLHERLTSAPDRPEGARVCVGLGPPAPTAEGLHGSLRAAERALLVARIGALGDVVDWEELGPLQLLSQLDPAAADDMVLRLRALAREDRVLHETLERYLDHAGDAQATAASLGVHRGTLYNRLRRVEEITGTSLADGTDRLWLHMALKARFVLPS